MNRRALAIVGFATLALVSCGSSGGSSAASGSLTPSPTEATSTPGTSSTATPVVTASGSCANDYFPVVAGASWTYRTHVAPTTSVVHQTFGSIGPDGFTVIISSPQGGERDVWRCSTAGLADTEQYVTGPGGGPPPAGTVVFHGFVSRGVTIPADLHVGSTWKQVVTSHAKFSLVGVSYPEIQVVTTSSRVLGQTSVTTPAGTFQALKIQVTSSMHKTNPTMGLDTTSVSHGTVWVVRGVGIVESITTNQSGFRFTTLLLAYHIA